jgi:hypothetical protein
MLTLLQEGILIIVIRFMTNQINYAFEGDCFLQPNVCLRGISLIWRPHNVNSTTNIVFVVILEDTCLQH